MSRRNGVIRDPAERLYGVNNPVCLERREEVGEEAAPFRLLAGLARKTGRALARALGRGREPC